MSYSNPKELYKLERLMQNAKQKKLDVWIVGTNQQHFKENWKIWLTVIHDLNEIKPTIITNSSNAFDGKNPMNAIIILLDRWWENKNAKTLLELYIPHAFLCRQIGDI